VYSLGRLPTFYEERGDRLLEVHLIDFDGDLYGQRLDVQFVRLLRRQRRFEGVDDLIAQLHRDVDAARAALHRTRPPRSRPLT
jgi:riboflavin kinase/FMN adenylyltransferase